jgi:hypothetical protein
MRLQPLQRPPWAPYQDYRKALADGYQIFLTDVPQPQYHFTKYEYGREAWSHFDPTKSLLHTKTLDAGYKLVGAMYTDRVDATEDELNERMPSSIAQQHQHINFCKAHQAIWIAHDSCPSLVLGIPSLTWSCLRYRRLIRSRVPSFSSTSYSPLSLRLKPRTQSSFTMVERWIRQNTA